MADEQDWDGYSLRSTLESSDTLLAKAADGSGVRVPGSAIVRSVGGKVGIGAEASDRKLDLVGGHPDTSVRLFAKIDEVNAASLDLFASHPGISYTAAGIGSNINKHPNAGKRDPNGSGGYVEFTDLGNILFGTSTIGGPLVARFTITNASVAPVADNALSLGAATTRWSQVYAATGSINTSDEREKEEIGAIPDAWLDAWGDVQWSRFKFVDGNRWHIGLVAQQVRDAFASHDLDAAEIGLLCFDEWEEETTPIYEEQTIEIEQEVEPGLYRKVEQTISVPTGATRIVREAGNRFGLRYDECQAMEAAWQRREIARMQARLDALEAA